ncbi:MAG: hypothetical protein GTO45_23715 [Candidatus Aminicenantes bacterium]|nr:hypothetical protein [Candidatus Aminicenantes bacterium]NIM81766.1 hypothetical protein [Candidatus Aminicenantes bacterium]NIN21138.1 hypothetical protein [Candidatus Aminicenantes bacterium]NIN44960.1 hypothetical protein [Candidatus Aminicenantes bacterium]NIN87774.1 hypothetical protein [Candidatus Aminicenantes bacterium]
MKKNKFVFFTIILTFLLLSWGFSDTDKSEGTNPFKRNERPGKRVKIVVEQVYSNAEGVKGGYIRKDAEVLCRTADLEPVESDTQNYDILLKISLNGEALGLTYIGKGFQYSGASIRGTILLEKIGEGTFKKSFKGFHKPPDMIESSYPDPASAPFGYAYQEKGSLLHKLCELFLEIYGIKKFIPLFEGGNRVNVTIQAALIKAIIEIGKPAVEPLLTALKSKSSRIRYKVISCLAGIKDIRVVDSLIKVINDDKLIFVRQNAIRALSKQNDPRIIGFLINLLQNNEWRIRAVAADALGDIGDTQAVKPLINLLDDIASYVRDKCRDSLRRLTLKDFGYDKQKWRIWWQANNKKKGKK